MNCPAWGEAELRDKLIWEELAETSHRAGSKPVILCPAKTTEILLLNTVDKTKLPGKNLVHRSIQQISNGYLNTVPESRSRTCCVQILEKVESSEENLCEKEGRRKSGADGISCDIEEVKFYARPSHPVSSSVCSFPY